MFEARLKKKN